MRTYIKKFNTGDKEYQIIFRLFGYCALCYSKYYGGCWFRVFARGFKVKDITKRPLLFSERMGLNKHIQIGKYRISVLKKDVAFQSLSKEKIESKRNKTYEYAF